MSDLKDFLNLEKENKIVFGGESNNENITNVVVPLIDIIIETKTDLNNGDLSEKLAKAKITKLSKDISEELSKRFGFDIKLSDFVSKENLIKSFMINSSYDNLYTFKNEMLDNKVDDFLSFIKDSNRVSKSKKSLKTILKSLDSDGVNVDIKNLKIMGMDLFLDVFIDFAKAANLNLNPSEIFSLIIYEIGKVFVNTEILYKQVHLSSSVSNEIIKDNINIENIKIVSEKYLDKNIKDGDVVYVFNELITNYRDKVEDSFNKTEEVKEGIINFVNVFNLGNEYTNAIMKINNSKGNVEYFQISEELWDITVIGLITIVTSIVFMVFAFILVPIVVAMGLLKIGLNLAIIVIKIFLNIVKFVFGKAFGNKNKALDILNTLKAFKRNYIGKIRKIKDSENKKKYLNNIKYLDYQIDKISKVIKYDSDKRLKETNEMNKDYKINKLKDNDLQYLSEKI